MQICSFVAGTCDQAMQRAMPFNSFHECSIAGHLNSIKVIQELGTDFNSQNKTVVRFWCRETGEI